MTRSGDPWWTVPMIGWSDDRRSEQERGRTTRHALLLAAADLFAARGYHGASLTDILKVSGRTKGALYFHFSSKQALAQALQTEIVASWELVRAEIAARGLDPLKELLVETDAYVGRWTHDPIVRGAGAAMASADVFTEGHRTWYRDWQQCTAAHLHRARKDGLLQEDIDPDRASRLIVAAGAGHHAFSEILPGPPDFFARMTDTWQGLLPAVAVDSWLAEFRASGWDQRPAPDPAAFARLREP